MSAEFDPPSIDALLDLWRRHATHAGTGIADALSQALEAGGRVVLSGESAPQLGLDLVQERVEAGSRAGRPVIRFDLEGWEPGFPLGPFLRFCSAQRGTEASATDLLDSLPAGDDEATPEQAASLFLRWCADAHGLETDSPAAKRAEGDAVGGGGTLGVLIGQLGARGAVLVLTEPEALPEAVLQVLRRVDNASLVELRARGKGSLAGLPGSGLPGCTELELPAAPAGPELDQALSGWHRRVAALDPDGSHGLVGLLTLLAECRGPAPIELLARVAGGEGKGQGDGAGSEEALEDLVDLVDDVLVEELGLLVDLQYHHPGFAVGLYDFAHPALRQAFLVERAEDSAEAALEESRARVLDGLRRRLGLRQRGPAALIRRLASFVGHDELVERTTRRLAFWGGHDHIADFERAVADGAVEVEDLWRLATQPGWPPTHRERALDTWARLSSEVETTRLVDHPRLRSEILRLLGRGPEAMEAATRALELAGTHHGTRSSAFLSAQYQCAVLLSDLGQHDLALEQMKAVVELGEEILDPADPKRPVLQGDLGRALLDMGELRNGRDALRRALEATVEIYGDDHPNAARRRNNLAGVLMEVGELENARDELEKAWPVFAREHGPAAPETLLSRHNLAAVLSELGEKEQSKELLREGLQLERRVYEGRPEMLPTLTRLASLELDDDPATARDLYAEALALAREIYGEDHPAVDAIRSALVSLAG